MKKCNFIVLALILIIVSLTVVRTVISSNISTSGTILGNVNGNINKYKFENSLLYQKILNFTSLTIVSEKAGKLKFIPQKSLFSVSTSLPIAVKP